VHLLRQRASLATEMMCCHVVQKEACMFTCVCVCCRVAQGGAIAVQDGHITVTDSRFELNGVWGYTYVRAH
jgi:hypothetical protein